MAVAGTWVLKEYHWGSTEDDAAVNYRVLARCASYTIPEAQRFVRYWLYNTAFTITSGGLMTLGDDSDTPMTLDNIILNADNTTAKVFIVTYDTDPENAHEDLIDDIKTVEDALTANDTQVTQANTATTGEIEVYATGKITATVGTP